MITVDARWLDVSGMGTYLRNLIPGIIEAFSAQPFTLLGNVEEIGSLGIAGARNIEVVPTRSSMYSVAEQFEIARKIPRGTRLYFAPHYNIPLLYRGRMLVTVYDLFHMAMPALVGGLHKRLYARFMFNAVRRRAAAVITISRFTRDELIRFTGEAKQPIYPIHLGVEEAWFQIAPGESPNPKRYVLYVGNVKPHKNLTVLVKAFGAISGQVPHDLVIVGKKEGFITGDESVLREAERLGGRVRFTGYVDDDILKRYFAHADVLACPSLYEGFGLPPLEAMAAGCPVLVSNAGSLPEICGDAAIYCDPYKPEDIASKLLGLLSDEKIRQALRQKGIERARMFSWDACVRQTCDVIRGLLTDAC